jgi:hypothetical protein
MRNSYNHSISRLKDVVDLSLEFGVSRYVSLHDAADAR